MSVARRMRVLSILAHSTALFLSILCRPYAAPLRQPIEPDRGYPEDYGTVIGIDLGRAYSRVGIFRNYSFEIIPDEQGRTAIPNYVAFLGPGTPPLVGFEAKEQASRNVRNTVYDFRLLLGHNSSSPELQETIEELKYNVIELGGEPLITIGTENDLIGYTPIEIQTIMLKKLKGMAETYLNTTITHAVITFPSDFTYNQREAIRESAATAGITVLRQVSEALAIAIAYRVDSRQCDDANADSDCTYVLYQQKERESELTLLLASRGVFEILGTIPDQNLRINELDETSTLGLVFSQEPSIHGTEEIQALVGQLLGNANVAKEAVDGIIFTGDSQYITNIQNALKAYFPGKEALEPSGFSQDQAIVCGAAMQGHLLSDGELEMVSWVDVNVLSLGIEMSNGAFFRVINRNNVIPRRKTLTLSTSVDSQEKIVIRVFEGEREVACKNRLLGVLELVEIPKDLTVRQKIDIAFEVDPNEVLTVTAELHGGSEVGKLVVATRQGARYTNDEIEDMVLERELSYKNDMQELREASEMVPNGVEEWKTEEF